MGQGRRVGIMGGTFDPIHIGHLIIAERAFWECGLDTVIFIPAGNPPHKTVRPGRPGISDRYEMTRLAIAGNPHFTISDAETDVSHYSYSYETLEAMKEKAPDDHLFFIVGADSVRDMETWMKPDRICAAASLIAARRPGTDDEELAESSALLKEKYGADILTIDMPLMDFSSSSVRAMIRDGLGARYFVPDAVFDYIETHGLYRK